MSFLKEIFRSIARVFGRVIAYIIIGTIIYFIVGAKVNAAFVTLGGDNIVSIRNSSGTILSSNTSNTYPNQATLTATLNNSKTNTKFRIELPNLTWATANFDFIVNYTIIVRNDSTSVVNLALTQTKYYWEGGVEITSGCSTTFSRSDSAMSDYIDQSYFYVTTSCYGISPPSNKNNIYIETPLTSISSGGSYAFRGISLTNAQRDARANSETNNNQEVINSINNQTTTIINNNNANTQNITNAQNETTNAINNMTDSITDTSEPTNYDFFNNIGLSNDTPISNMLLFPITLLNAINTSTSASCSPVSLGSLFGTELILPCINLEQRFGSSLWSSIDTITSIIIIYNLVMMVVAAFEDMTSLNDSYTSLTARHSAENVEYQPRHGGGS